MTDGEIPDQARNFLLRNIDSIAQWEGLLLLRAHADQDWDVASIARHLYISTDETQALLARLAARGLVAASDQPEGPRFRYQPESAELDAEVTATAELYRRYLIPMTHLIHSRPKTRVQEFANAFRIRKD